MNYKNTKSKDQKLLSAVQLLPSLTVFSGLILTLVERIKYINDTFGATAGCNKCFTKNVIIFDTPFLLGLFVLYILSLTNTPLLFRIITRTTTLLGALLYIGDHIISQNMYTRLQFADISTYGSQIGLIANHLKSTNFLGLPLSSVIVASGSLAFLFVLLPFYPIQRKYWASYILTCTLLGVTAFAVPPTVYVHNWAMKNVISANLAPGVAQEYSANYRSAIEPAAAQACKSGTPHNDIVLLILESWSPYQSTLWEGKNNWTPNLDAIAEQNTYFSQFYAAGFTTNEGLASTLTGLKAYSPINPFFATMPFQGLWSTTQATAPRYATNSGYHSAFFTTGDLSFSKKGEWLNNIGFDYVEGHDAPFYDNLPRLHFRSAADEHLYSRTLEYMQEHQHAGKPLFITVENVSSHQPFIHPHTRERNIQATFKYMDKMAANFYHSLEAAGFFAKGGIFIAVSDHRSMTPISQHEQQHLGHLAASKIPAFIAYQGAPAKKIDQLAHQSDILPSLKHYLSDGDCPHPNNLDLFSSKISNKDRCVFHARGDQRDHIDVICSHGSGTIKLDGDDSKFIYSNNLSSKQKKSALLELARTRIELQTNHRQWSTNPDR